ncbi:unnamed protein product [Gordionus sp. m RMFG-2023]
MVKTELTSNSHIIINYLDQLIELNKVIENYLLQSKLNLKQLNEPNNVSQYFENLDIDKYFNQYLYIKRSILTENEAIITQSSTLMDNKELISSDPDSDPFILSNNVELVMNTIQDQRNLKPYNLKECCVALTRLNSDFLIEYFSKYQEQKNLNYSLLNMFVEEIMDNQIIMDDFKDKNQIMNDMNEKELENSLVDQFIHILDNQKCQSDQKYNINIKQDLIKQIDDYLLTKPSIEMVKPEHDTHNAIPEKYLKLLKTKLSKTTLIRKNPDMPLKKFK